MGKWIPTDEKSLSSYGFVVNAWMPIPEPYRREGIDGN